MVAARKSVGGIKAVVWIGGVFLTGSMGLLTGCSADVAGQPSEKNAAALSEVPDIVQQKAEQFVEERYLAGGQSVDSYSDWRIESLTHCYTYEDFEGMVLQVYQLNYEFLSDRPDEVQLVGGMSVDEEGWVVVSYPNSDFFLFQEEGDTLAYVGHMFENDCLPGDEIFTGDLRRMYLAGDLN